MYSLVAACAIGSVGALGAPVPGQIIVDPNAPGSLMRMGGEHLFVCGPGDPEGFLYRGTLQHDGTRAGDQIDIIQRMLTYGGNCLYLQAVRSHGGDGAADHNPFLGHDPGQGVNQALIDQWEEWFTLMDEHGILIYFFFYDDSANIWPTGDDVGVEEKVFIETLVNRFEHHRNLIWILAEESEEAFSTRRAERLAGIIRAADDHNHIVGNHHQSGVRFKSWKPGGPFDHFAMQLNVPLDEVHERTRAAVTASGGRYQLIYAENTDTPQTIKGWRHHAWTVAMAGTMPMLLGMDVATTPADALRQCRILSEFFEDTDFFLMNSAPHLAAGLTRDVLYQHGQSFIAWSDKAEGEAQLDLKGIEPGTYELLWVDCITGRRVEAKQNLGSAIASLSKPASIGAECAVSGVRVREVSRSIVQPGEEWEWRTPAEAGLNKTGLDEFAALAGGRGCIVREGRMVYSWGDISRPGDVASASKPVYSHLLFRAIERGLLESADDPVMSYQPCLNDINRDLDFKDRRMTFRHLAFQTACLGYEEPPGGAYDYNDYTMGFFWDTLVNGVFDTTWAEARADLFGKELVDPLQFEDPFDFPTEGRTRGRPRISPRDFARFGWLYFSEGSWHDRQIINPRHVRLAARDPLSLTVPRTRAREVERCAVRSIGGGGNQTDHNGGYSWLWWVNALDRGGQRWWTDAPPDMYCALGHCGQRGLAILPSQQMVVSWNDGRELHCDRDLGNRAFSALAAAAHP